MRWDKMAMMMIYQCNKTRDLIKPESYPQGINRFGQSLYHLTDYQIDLSFGIHKAALMKFISHVCCEMCCVFFIYK